MKKLEKIITIIAVVFAMLCTSSCGAGKDPEKSEITIPVDTLEQYAQDSVSLWELTAKLMPDRVVYKDKMGKFVYEKINKDLPLNEYDWSNLSNCIKGVDVSKYQGTINWEQVSKTGVKFAMVRLGYRGYTEGQLYVDPFFEQNVTQAAKAGISVGVYFLSKALTEDEALEEAEFILENIAPYNITWPVVLDLEPVSEASDRTIDLSADERTELYQIILDKIAEAGYTPMIYADVSRFMSELDMTKLTGYDKWFAQYFNQPYFKYKFTIWQATNTGQIYGINGNVDINYAIVNYNE